MSIKLHVREKKIDNKHKHYGIVNHKTNNAKHIKTISMQFKKMTTECNR